MHSAIAIDSYCIYNTSPISCKTDGLSCTVAFSTLLSKRILCVAINWLLLKSGTLKKLLNDFMLSKFFLPKLPTLLNCQTFYHKSFTVWYLFCCCVLKKHSRIYVGEIFCSIDKRQSHHQAYTCNLTCKYYLPCLLTSLW